jgi:bla regulator protein blaR1
MTPSDVLSGPLAQAIGLALLHALWQGAIVAGVAAAILGLLSRRSAAVRYAVACGALAIIFSLTIATAVRSYSPRHDSDIDVTPAFATSVAAPNDSVLIAASATPLSWNDRWLEGVAIVRMHIPQIMMIWLFGVLILTLRLAASWTRARALASRGSTPVGELWQRAAARLSEALGLRTAVHLVVSGGIDVPSVVGWLKPSILLPISSFTGLTTDQLEMVLAHELAHIKRHDFLVNAMQSFVETLLFYHPAVWWVSHQIRVERENCCDDLAVSVSGDAIRYARALAQLEELRGVPALAIAANGGSLIERVRRLVGARSDRSLFSNGWTAAAAMASFVALLALTTAPMLAARRQTTPPKQAQTEVTVQAPQKTPKPEQAAPPAPGDNADESDEPAIAPEVMVLPEPPEPPETPETPEPPIAAAPMVIAPRLMAMPRMVIAPVARARAHAALAIAGITPEAISEGVAGAILDISDDQESSPTPPGKLSINELIALRVQGITPEYIQQMRSTGFADLSLRDIITFRTHGVTPEYVQKMRSAGLGNLTPRDIASLRIQGVTPEYAAGIRSAGVPIKSARDLVSLKVQGVTPEFVQQLAAAGYDKLTVRDLVRLAASGVNADFIREMSKYKK